MLKPLAAVSLLLALASGLAFAVVQGHDHHHDAHAALEDLRPDTDHEGPFVMVSRMTAAPKRMKQLVVTAAKLGKVARKQPGLEQLMVLADESGRSVTMISVWQGFDDFVEFHNEPAVQEAQGLMQELHESLVDFEFGAPELVSGWTRPTDSKKRNQR